MANLPEKNVVLVDKITNVPTDSNLFINANGEFKQASVNDVVNSSTVVSTAVETAINTAVQDSIDSHFKQATGSPILLTDSADGVLIDFKGYGRSTQNGTPTPDSPIAIKSVADSGYYDGELLNGYYNSSTGEYVSQASGRICSKNPIPCKSGDVVKIVLENNVSNIYICYYGENGYISMLYGTENTNFIEKTIPNGATYFTFWAVNSGMTVDTVGHIAVTINGKYSLIVKSVGKNFLKVTCSSTTLNGVTRTVNNDGSVTLNGTATADISSSLGTLSMDKGSYILNGCPSGGSLSSHFLAIPSLSIQDVGNGKKFTITNKSSHSVYLAIAKGQTLNNVTFYPMIRPVGTDDTYEPYKETVTYIPLNEPLRSSLDGTVTDEVSFTEVNRRFAEVVFDGSSDEQWLQSSSCFYINLYDAKVDDNGYCKALCTHFKNHNVWLDIDGGKIDNSFTIYKYRDWVNSRLAFHCSNITTGAEWITWLQANPIKVIYELAEPITETIEPVDIVTYDNVTYLTASDNADMEIEYPTTKVAGIASIGYSKGIKAEYETEQLKKQLLEIQATIVNTL